jgi:hypothetical protein
LSELPDLSTLRIDDLRRAVAIYLELAYPSGELPEPVRRRLAWPEDLDVVRLTAGPPFERVTPPGEDRVVTYALRLGNARYPHMKLQVQPWAHSAGYLFSVNTHDQILAPAPDAADAEAFRALQAENQRIKEAIEAAWDRAGLPIFLRYLREYIDAQAGAIAAEPEDAD